MRTLLRRRPIARQLDRRPRSRPAKAALWTFLVLLAARAALPSAVRAYANKTLARLKGYRGHIGDVDIALWRGAYRINDIRIEKMVDGAYRPLLSAAYVDLAVSWGALLKGALVASVVVDHPVVDLILEPAEPAAAPEKPPAPTPAESYEEVHRQLAGLAPLRIDRVLIRDGFVRVRRTDGQPPSDLRLADLQASASNLTNSARLSHSLVASARATGRIFGGRMRVELRANPMAEKPAFDLDAALRGGDMTALNEFLRAYGGFDAQAGSFQVFVEAAAADGRVQGYVKPVFEGLKIFKWGEKHKDAGRAFWEALVAASAEVLENQPKDRLAARIPFEGTLDEPGVKLWPAVASVLRNAFIRSLTPRLEQSIKVRFRRGSPAPR